MYLSYNCEKKVFVILVYLFLRGFFLAHAQEDIINVENNTIRNYLSDNTYKRYRTTGSVIGVNVDTVSIAPRYRNNSYIDNPSGYSINWTRINSNDNISGYVITVSSLPDFSRETRQVLVSNAVTNYTFYNLVPGTSYYYKVEEKLKDNRVVLNKSGNFCAAGQLRMLKIDGVRNVRDLGGWPTQSGFHVRYGRLFRCAALDYMTANGRTEMVDILGVTAELDLRGSGHTCSLGSKASYEYINNYQDYYSGLYSLAEYKKNHARAFKWVLQQLKAGRNVCFHCQYGRDRTGTLAFLLEGVLGVDFYDIFRDYEISSFTRNYNNSERAIISYHTFYRMIPYIRMYGPVNNLEKCFANYLISCGVTCSEIDEFRMIMLDIPEDEKIQDYILRGVNTPSQNTDINDDGSVNVADIFHLKLLLNQFQ